MNWTTLEQQRIRFKNALNAMAALRSQSGIPNDRLDGLIAATRETVRTLTELQTNTAAVNSKTIVAAHRRLQNEIISYTKAISKVEHLPRAENRAVWDLITVTNDYTNQTIRPLREAVDAMNADVDKLLATDMAAVSELGRRSIMFSREPAGTASRSDVTTVGQLLWVGETISLAERTNQFNQDFKNSGPYQNYRSILARISSDTPAAQIRCARLLANRELQLTNQLARTYQALSARFGADADGIRKVREALVVDDTYRAARSYFALKRRLMDTPLAQPLRMAERKIIRPNSRGVNVSALLDGSVEQALERSANGRKALADARKRDTASYSKAGMPVNDFSRQLFDLASAFATEEKSSPSPFNTVADQLFAVGREGIAEGETASPTYLKKLRACYFTAQTYLNTHNPISRAGKHRLSIVESARDLMERRLKELAPKDRSNDLLTDTDAEKARLLANVGTAKIHTQVPTRRRDVSSIRTNNVLRGFAHKLYSGLVALEQISTGAVTNIAGGIMHAVRRLKGKTAGEQNARRFDPEHVPGMAENERFREPEGNSIITDKRRVPLVWEIPIPEDTDQPITLTFEVDQPFEGSDVGSDWLANAVGHAFLTLKYTKQNPVTGKPERYKTSFGFYPMYSGPTMNYASGSTGLKMPGIIKQDLHHPTAVGATVNITPQQFNDIVRFTGEYERGGYNMINRNCAHFAYDAVKHAGIEIPELKDVKQVDLTNNGIGFGTGIFFGDLLVGKALVNAYATRTIIQGANKPNTVDYARIGQGKTNLDDIERCSCTELNMRLKGYAPGEMAEAIRGSTGISLHSRKYLGTDKTRQTAFDYISKNKEKKFADDGFSAKSLGSAHVTDEGNIFRLEPRDYSLYFLKLMEEEVPRMRRSIEAAYSKADRAELAKDGGVLDRLDEFHRKSHDAIAEYARIAFHKKTFKDADRLDASAKAARQGVKAINDYIRDLNGIFHDTFRSDPRVNICFQNMVSLAEWLREDFYAFYGRTTAISDAIMAPEADLSDTAAERVFLQKAEQRLFDPSRDASHAMWNVSHTEITFRLKDKGKTEWFSMRPSEYLATLLAFQDPEDAFRKIKDDNDSDIIALRNTMVNALETLQDGHEYTDGELDIVFNRLPKHEQKVNAGTTTSSSYQAMALSAILGDGFLGDMNASFQQMLSQRYNDIALTNDFLSREENEKLRAFDYSQVNPSELAGKDKEAYEAHIERKNAIQNERLEKENNFFDLLTDYTEYVQQQLDEKLRTLPKEKKDKLDNVLRIMTNNIVKDSSIHAGDTAGMQNALRQARTSLGHSLANGYVNNICKKAINAAVLDPKLNEVISMPYSRWTTYLENTTWLPEICRTRSRSVHQTGPNLNADTLQNHPRTNSFSGMKK